MANFSHNARSLRVAFPRPFQTLNDNFTRNHLYSKKFRQMTSNVGMAVSLQETVVPLGTTVTTVQNVTTETVQTIQPLTVTETVQAVQPTARIMTEREMQLAAAEPYNPSMGLPGHQNKAAVALAARPLGHWRRLLMPLLSIMFIALLGVSMFQLYIYVTSHQPANLQPIPANLAKRGGRIGDVPDKRRQLASRDLKMVFLLVDALGWAFVNGTNVVDQSSQMGAVVNSPVYSKDAKLYKVGVQLPSMSLPNWYTDWIGVAPEMHGITGNFDLPPTKYVSFVV